MTIVTLKIPKEVVVVHKMHPSQFLVPLWYFALDPPLNFCQHDIYEWLTLMYVQTANIGKN